MSKCKGCGKGQKGGGVCADCAKKKGSKKPSEQEQRAMVAMKMAQGMGGGGRY
jgi:hypothetical protein